MDDERLGAPPGPITTGSLRRLLERTRLARKWSFPWAHTDHPDRHMWPETLLIERYLSGVKPGTVVADIGAGAGYWTFRLADVVGVEGTVYAIDSSLDVSLKLLYEKRRRKAENVKVRWVGRRNPRLRKASVDVVLIVNAHLFAESRVRRGRRFLRRCAAALRPGGKVVLFNRAVHTIEWVPDFGRPLGYNESLPEQVIAMAEPELVVEAQESLPIGGPGPARGELPGYLLVLRRPC